MVKSSLLFLPDKFFEEKICDVLFMHVLMVYNGMFVCVGITSFTKLINFTGSLCLYIKKFQE